MLTLLFEASSVFLMLHLQFYLSLLCDPSKEFECKFAVIACPNQCDFYYSLYPICPFHVHFLLFLQ